MTKLYADTNVYLEVIEKRRNYEDALAFFSTVQQKNFKLIVSDWVLEELYKYTDEQAMAELFAELKDNMIHVTYSQKNKEEAKELSPTNWNDALHAVIAKKEGASYIITFNKRDFYEFEDLVKPKFPSEFF